MRNTSGRSVGRKQNPLAEIVSQLGLPALLLNPSGAILAVSPEAAKLLGLTDPASKTLALSNILSPRNPEWISREIRKHGAQEGWAGDVVVVRPDGSERWTLVRACRAPELMGGSGELLFVLEDATERTEITNALMQRAEDLFDHNWELELVNRVSKLMLSSSDLESRLNAVIEEVAKAAQVDSGIIALLDRDKNELVCRATYGKVPASYVGHVSLPMDAESFTVGAVRERKTRVTPDASQEPEMIQSMVKALCIKAAICVPLVVGDEAFGMVVLADSRKKSFTGEEITLVEILARNVATAIHTSLLSTDMQLSKAYWQRTFDAIGEMVFLLDPNGKFLHANSSLASRLNMAPSDIEGKACSELLPDVANTIWRAAIRARHACSLGELRIAGEICEGEAFPLFDGTGKPDAAVICARIVTRERRMREEIRRASTHAAVGELLAGSANSIGQVLKSIDQLLKKTGKTKNDGDTPVDQIRTQVRAGTEIVQRLMNFSHGFEGKAGRVSVKQVTEAALALCKNHPAAKTKTVRNTVSPSLPTVEACRGPLQEAIFNLLLNALESTAPGGNVAVSARHLNSQGVVELRVTDNGSGMKPEVREHAFEPFYSTKGGTGLGLSTSVAALHNMGGVLTLNTVPGQGTVVTVRLNVAGRQRRPGRRIAA